MDIMEYLSRFLSRDSLLDAGGSAVEKTPTSAHTQWQPQDELASLTQQNLAKAGT